MFISFEGLDYSGKSTQVKLLKATLDQRGIAAVVLREPGGTVIGEQMRSALLDRKNSGLTQSGELFLFSASRAQLVQDVIRPALSRKEVVICDRYVDSTTAYQGYGRQIPLDLIAGVNRLATGGLLPGRTYFLDIPIDVIHSRIQTRGSSQDRMESSGKEFFERVRKGFLAIAEIEKRFLVIDGQLSVEQIHQLIIDDLRSLGVLSRI